MIGSKARHSALFIACCILAACGGGGGGGIPIGAIPPGGPPSFSVTPAARGTLGSNTAAPVTASSSGPNFSNAGPAPVVGTAFPLLQSALQVDTNGVSPTTTANNGGATLVVAAGDALQLKVPSLGIDVLLPSPTFTASGPGGSTVSLAAVAGDHFLGGVWTEMTASDGTVTQFVTGYQSPAAAAPTIGQAIYDDDNALEGAVFGPSQSAAVLDGDVTLTADFATGAVTGSLHDITATDVSNGGTSLWNNVTVNATIASGSSTFAGATGVVPVPTTTFSLTSGAAGFIDGRFYGPQLDELAAVWTLTDNIRAAYGIIGARNISGGAAGAGCSPTFTWPSYTLPAHTLNNAAQRFAQCPWWTSAAPYFGSPVRATRGTNPVVPQLAMPGGPALDGNPSYPPNGLSVVFPLIETAVNITANGISGDISPSTGATIAFQGYAGGISSYILDIPSLGITHIPIQAGATPESGWHSSSSGFTQVDLEMWGLSYVGFGAWAHSDMMINRLTDVGHFMFGFETPSGAMPVTGTANFNGTNAVSGTVFVPVTTSSPIANVAGDAALTVNFATGLITGSFTNMRSYNMTVTEPWNDVSVNANIANGTNTFSGATSATTSPISVYSLKPSASGFIDGGFYGPNAEELGAVWTLSNGDGTGSAIGVVGARRQ